MVEYTLTPQMENALKAFSEKSGYKQIDMRDVRACETVEELQALERE